MHIQYQLTIFLTGKGKKMFVPIKEKLEVLKRINRRETLENIAANCDVGETTVGNWRQYINRILTVSFS